MGQFLPADHSKGDANTVGGYIAVHARPPAFEGKDGSSYSVEIMTDETGDPAKPWAGYLLFVRYAHGDPVASGHIETGYLRYAETEEGARILVGAMSLNSALIELNNLIAAKSSDSRPWYEVMRDEPE
jgi:hypothetical protein